MKTLNARVNSAYSDLEDIIGALTSENSGPDDFPPLGEAIEQISLRCFEQGIISAHKMFLDHCEKYLLEIEDDVELIEHIVNQYKNHKTEG